MASICMRLHVANPRPLCDRFLRFIVRYFLREKIILVWPTQLDPALRTLFVFVCVFPSEVRTPLFDVTSSNVELRNYVISRQNIFESGYVIR